MPTLGGPFDLFGDAPPEPCRWCGEPTSQKLAPLGALIAPVPMHAVCGAEVIVAYQRMMSGSLLPTDDRERLERLTIGNV